MVFSLGFKWDLIDGGGGGLSCSSVELLLPKFSISAESSLGEILKEMGVTNAFTNAADFSGMSAEIKLKVSKVGVTWQNLYFLKLELIYTTGWWGVTV